MDLLTGNHLLRKRSDEQLALMKEFALAINKAENDETLSDRDKELIKTMSEMFHDGIEDMCEQLNIDKSIIGKL